MIQYLHEPPRPTNTTGVLFDPMEATLLADTKKMYFTNKSTNDLLYSVSVWNCVSIFSIHSSVASHLSIQAGQVK